LVKRLFPSLPDAHGDLSIGCSQGSMHSEGQE
jgi:hypothetical protein